jgi:hypothetical protein
MTDTPLSDDSISFSRTAGQNNRVPGEQIELSLGRSTLQPGNNTAAG